MSRIRSSEVSYGELKDSNFMSYLLTIISIALILSLFVLSNLVTYVLSYRAGDNNGRQYVISSIELQKCGILKKNFKKGE